MNIRYPARAGQFYESASMPCEHHAQKLFESVVLPDRLPSPLYGGIVPHAGWMYSGKLAASTLKALDADAPLERVVIFGADHVGQARQGEVYDSGVWRTPMGEVAIDRELAEAIISAGDLLRSNVAAHEGEHAIEVQVPLLQYLRPNVTIVPIIVPPTGDAVKIGDLVGATLAETFGDAGIRVIGSTDLTHHAGHFPAPGGRGAQGVQWARENDHRIIELIEAMDAGQIVPEAQEHENACGGGAIAATIAACRAMGASAGITLAYSNSYEIIHQIYPSDADDTTVGYLSAIFA